MFIYFFSYQKLFVSLEVFLCWQRQIVDMKTAYVCTSYFVSSWTAFVHMATLQLGNQVEIENRKTKSFDRLFHYDNMEIQFSVLTRKSELACLIYM